MTNRPERVEELSVARPARSAYILAISGLMAVVSSALIYMTTLSYAGG